ncbi:MAG: LEA type 2 family protein [Candidatus Kapabacteria bacterium]|nr:LEA type 2 family protein [Candidatus Kapabacteria bacterium]
MKRLIVIASLFFIASLNGCSQLKQLSDALASLQRLQFKLNSVSGMQLAGINITSKQSLTDFNPLSDGLALLNAYRTKSLPATFTLMLDVNNPNNGQNGSRSMPATLKGLDFRMLVDGKQTISGDIGSPFSIPASGAATSVPVNISLDLLQFFGDKGYDDIINLALALGGKNGSASRLTLDARPTVSTSLGDMTYPGRINIIDKEFRN